MWRKVVCQELKDELTRLKNGNADEVQRYENAVKAMATVLANPIFNDEGKSGTGHYRATEVLAQYRLFYETIDASKVVHFVWLNNDEYIHDSSKDPDPCYARFIHLFQRDKLAKYIPPKAPESPYQLTGTFGKSERIYAKYEDPAIGKAYSALNITTEDKRTYRIHGIDATVEGEGLEDLLLGEVIKSASGLGILLCFDLDHNRDPSVVRSLEKLLSRHGFNPILRDRDMELWELQLS